MTLPTPTSPSPTSPTLLIVLAGRPGTGKTTLARRLAGELRAAYLRIDAIETAVVRAGLATAPVGPIGYAIAHDLAVGTLAVGTPVVIDAVNPVPEARAGWWLLADRARVEVLETILPDENEHRRRVAARRPDLVGQTVPTWADVQETTYVPWDETRDGPRFVVDMTDTERAVAAALQQVNRPTGP